MTYKPIGMWIVIYYLQSRHQLWKKESISPAKLVGYVFITLICSLPNFIYIKPFSKSILDALMQRKTGVNNSNSEAYFRFGSQFQSNIDSSNARHQHRIRISTLTVLYLFKIRVPRRFWNFVFKSWIKNIWDIFEYVKAVVIQIISLYRQRMIEQGRAFLWNNFFFGWRFRDAFIRATKFIV